ncbi:hypothetical protein BC941DRAFT_389545 [Chlamydoabsidia padenii]|nr:hypothetical protein BC941DRAFT_389545 [Chlamydoabsidia padenii]
MTTPSTTLPSIQFLLTQQTFEDKKFTKGHRSTRSVSSLPSELQNLSLNGPSSGINQDTLPDTPGSKDDPLLVKPSWMAGPPVMLTPNNNNNPSLHQYHHQRSISDLTMPTPPLSSDLSSSSSYQTFDSSSPLRPAPTTPSLSPFHYNHHHHHHHHHAKHPQQQRHLSHRRAVSATTVDHMRRPSPPPFDALVQSPPEKKSSSSSSDTITQPMDDFMDKSPKTIPVVSSTDNIPSLDSSPSSSIGSHATVDGMDLPRDPVTGRYLCPYCQKPFSRPSSLRIHTYSHTGEKPFVCSECPRRFSVQSNMRRHLRIHYIKPTNKTGL